MTPPPMTWRLGTMGFGYDDWTGPFYAPATKSAGRLAAYATAFDAVELDTTFHAVPSREVVRRWRDETPDHFRFTAKLPKLVTHTAGGGESLDSPSLRAITADFLLATDALGEKRRAVLMQFPPSFGGERLAELCDYVGAWPESVPAAVELRCDSWWRPGVGPALARTLRAANMPWVAADEPAEGEASRPVDAPGLSYKPRPTVLTADWLYVRWLGRHRQFADRASERLDPTPRLAWWVEKLEELGRTGRVREVVGFFNNGYAGHSPASARRMLTRLGRPARDPPAASASLFPVV